MDKQELTEQLNKGFVHLTQQEKLILTLFYFEELSVEEIAYAMDIHLHTVNIDLSQAKTKMRGYTTIFDDVDNIGRKSMELIRKGAS